MNSTIISELERIKGESEDGLLHPERVVAAAASADSPLHGRFEWDDARAAAAHRVGQARTLIAAAIIMEPRLGEPIRAYVSLAPDRKAGGGYRGQGEVLEASDLRRILLADALREVDVLARRYVALHELSPIFTLASSLKAKIIGEEVTQSLAS